MNTTYSTNAMGPDDGTSRSKGSLRATGEERSKTPSKSSQNDVAEPKPPGRSETDDAAPEQRFLSCKRHKKIGTWNVRSMMPGKMELVTREMARTGIDILGI